MMAAKSSGRLRQLGAIAIALSVAVGLYIALARLLPEKIPAPEKLLVSMFQVGVPTYPLPDAFWRGMAAADGGDWTRAADEFRVSLAAAPDAPPVYLAMGTALGELGQNLRAALHLKAYLELWPDSPNADRVHARIMRLTAPYKRMSNALFDDATKLSQFTPDANWSRTYYDLMMVGAEPRVRDFIKVLPKGASQGISESYLVKRRFGAHVGGSEHALLRDAIAAEARYFGKDVIKTGCRNPLPMPDMVCPTPSELFGKPLDAVERARQCWANNGRFVPAAQVVSSDAIAAAISYHMAVVFKTSNLRLGEINGLLLLDYDRLRRTGVYRCDAFFVPPHGISIFDQGNGHVAATATGWLDFNAVEDAVSSKQYAVPSAAKTIRESRFGGEYEKLAGWEIGLSDAVFGDI